MKIYSLEQEKRGLCPYDDKRYLLANQPDGSPNPNTHAYGHKDLATEEQFVTDMPATPGTDLIIEHQERRFSQKHKRVVKTLRAMLQAEGVEVEEQPEGIEWEIPQNPDEWEQVARAAAARPGVAGRITDVIERLVAAGRPPNDSTQRAGPSGTYHPVPSPEPAWRDWSDEDEVDENNFEAHAATSRKRKRPRNPFILDEAVEAAEDDEEEEEEEEEGKLEELDTDYNDYEFIDDD